MKFPENLLKVFLTLTIILLCMVHLNIGTCQIAKHMLEHENRLVIKYENDSVNFLRDTKIENGTILYMICNNDDIIEVTCTNGQFHPQLPLTGCLNNNRVQLKLENNKSLCPYNLYRVGYKIRCQNKDYFFETYKLCFDNHRKRALFTINEAYPFVKPRAPGTQFDPDEIFTPDIFRVYRKHDIYVQFNRLLGDGQTFMPNNAGDERIDRGHLTPAGDFSTNKLIATTFKMANVIPQFHSINSGNWKNIEEWARHPINTPAKVCSGVLNYVLQLPDMNGNLQNMYLEPSIPIPLWTYKIVQNRNNVRTVFLQYNNIHDKQMPPQIPDGICRQTNCPSNINLAKSNYLGYTYCCNPDHFMAHNVPHLIGHC